MHKEHGCVHFCPDLTASDIMFNENVTSKITKFLNKKNDAKEYVTLKLETQYGGIHT